MSSADAHHVAIAVADTSRNQQLDVADSFGHRLETEGSLVRAIALLVQASYLSAEDGAKLRAVIQKWLAANVSDGGELRQAFEWLEQQPQVLRKNVGTQTSDPSPGNSDQRGLRGDGSAPDEFLHIFRDSRGSLHHFRGGGVSSGESTRHGKRTFGSKTDPCKFFLEGKCIRGSGCTFLHPSGKSRPTKGAALHRRDAPVVEPPGADTSVASPVEPRSSSPAASGKVVGWSYRRVLTSEAEGSS